MSPTDALLDAVLHQPTRTQIVAYLVGRGEATFTELKRVLDVSDGNLESHLKKLISADYVDPRKDSSNTRQQTLYSLTPSGQAALRLYTKNLQTLLTPPLKSKVKAGKSTSKLGPLAWAKKT